MNLSLREWETNGGYLFGLLQGRFQLPQLGEAKGGDLFGLEGRWGGGGGGELAWFSGCVRYNAQYRLQLKCVPLEDLFRTKPGVKSTQVRPVKEPNITDLQQI